VGIAIILALVTALVGPHFVDWAQYRPQLEAQASRILGSPVHIAGPIDVRILPTPSFSAGEVEIGPPGQESPVKVRDLSVELALGPLLHGVWQAADARVAGVELRLGLDQNGRVDWSVGLGRLDPDSVSIQQLTIADGRAVLTDAASGARSVVDHLSFEGDVRSLAGPIKGDGSFILDGRRYGFGITLARLDENAVAKVRLKLDALDAALAIAADGSLGLSGGTPQFDGNVTVSRPAGAVDASGKGVAFVPWQLSGQVKLTPSSALVPQGEFQYGPEDRGLKFTGAADLKLGRAPWFDVVISGQQLNLDTLLDLPEPARHLPVAALRRLAENFLGPVKLPIPGKVGLGIEAVTLAGKPIEDVHGDLEAGVKGWDLQMLEFRAPGLTHVRTSGRVETGSGGVTFDGAAAFESSDPSSLISWLEATPVPAARPATGPLRANGDVVLSSDQVVVNRLHAEFDHRSVEGRVDYSTATDQHPARVSAELNAADIDLDQIDAFVRAAFAKTKVDVPAEISLTANVGQATIAGVEARNSHVKLVWDAKGLVLDHVSVDDLAGAKIELGGRLDGLDATPHGALHLDLDAERLDGVIALLSKLTPGLAGAIGSVSAGLAPLHAHGVLNVSPPGSGAEAALSTLALQGSAGPIRLSRLAVEATGNPLKVEQLAVKANGEIVADSGPGLAALVGLDRYLVPGAGPATLTVAAQGPLGGELRSQASLSAGGVSVRISGSTQLGKDGMDAHLDVDASASDLGSAFRRVGAPDAGKLPLSLKGRIDCRPGSLALERIDATLAGSSVKGRLQLALGTVPQFEGRLDATSLTVPAAIATAIGFPMQPPGNASRTSSSERFAPGWFGKWGSHIEFNIAHATLTPALVAQNAHGFLRTGDGQIGLESVKAELAGGGIGFDASFRQTPAGLTTKTRVELSKVDTTAILPAADRPGVRGDLTLGAEVQGAGESPAALVASLSGVGTMSLDRGRLTHLDPGAFEAAMRAVDKGLPIVPPKILAVVAPALEAGDLVVPHVEGALTVASGQLRVINMIAHGNGADVAITGHVDLSNWTVDAQLTLTGPAGGAGLRPDILLALAGPVEGASRTVDVSAFANWLLLRSLDREVSRAEGANAATLPPRTGPPPASGSSPPNGGPSALSPIVELRPDLTTGEQSNAMALGEQAPLLPPPIEIGRAPVAERAPAHPRRTAKPARPGTPDTATLRPPPADPVPPRSFLDRLFRPER
jgi:large subunit ribosomal protein L24